ncbi:MAG: proton-coupled thiamine transporter YuaJ [Ruminococcus sp.]|nr:proton-coupled thiamine transporter YuaJ [Ruminococcus sp.]
MKRTNILPYVEGALVIAMSVVLSMIRIYKLPWGGSVTLLSMLPLVVYSNRYGLKRGLTVAFLFSVFQFFQGISDGIFAWGLSPVMLVGCILFDYILAYTAIGLSGAFRKRGVYGWVLGTIIALLLRFGCHFMSGVVIFHSAGKLWDGFSTDNTMLYSFLYNGSYMLPEIIFTCIGAVVILKVPAIQKIIKAK